MAVLNHRETEITLFLIQAGWEAAAHHPIAGDASRRRYIRLVHAQKGTAVLMDAAPELGEDVGQFLRISRHLNAIGLSAPKPLAADIESGLVLLEDLGSDRFAERIARDPDQQIPLMQAALEAVLHLQRHSPPDLPICESMWYLEALDPLLEHYPLHDSDKCRETITTAFAPHAGQLAQKPLVMIMRDYHTENLMFLPERQAVKQVGLLDFQDAMLGHPGYDLVSILQDARRDVDASVEQKMKTYFIKTTQLEAFEVDYARLGLQRNLRILGIFARLCLSAGRPEYLIFMPRVWQYIQRNLAHPDLADVKDVIDAFVLPPSPSLLQKLSDQCPHHPSLR
ncbi:MAG: phosphotransferase [Pseudomonadota bacterium]